MSSDTQTPPTGEMLLVAVGDIDVVDGHNPRTAHDAEADAQLAGSVRRHGVLSPLLVRPAEAEGRYVLIAGHRRLAAARAAGLGAVPALVRSAEPREDLPAALVENLQRRALNPLEEARGFARLRDERRLSQKRLAAELGLSACLVRERLRLLRLPEPVQAHLEAGTLPLGLVGRLEEIARVSPAVAGACAEGVAGGAVEAHELERQPGRVVARLGELAPADAAPPVAVAVAGWARLVVSELPLPAEQAEELTARAEALGGAVTLGEEDADAARAFGCLLEFAEDRYFAQRFICDPGFLADRVRLRLEQAEASAAERAAGARERRGDGAAGDAKVDAASEAERRRREREQARAEGRSARLANLELGARLVRDLHAPPLSAEVARLLALLVLEGQAGAIAARGLRYCLPDWQTVNHSSTKGGQTREKVTHLERHEAEERLYARLERAREPEEILGVLVQALVAAAFADEACVARSARLGWSVPGTHDPAGCPGAQAPALLERVAGDLLPPRLLAQARARRLQRERWAGDLSESAPAADEAEGEGADTSALSNPPATAQG